MAIAIFAPNSNQSSLNNGRVALANMSKQVSAALQSLGVTKTTLYGTGWINSKFSDWYFGTTQTSVTFTVPLHAKTNDYMLVTIAIASGTTVATPSGWSLLYTDTAAGGTGPIVQYVFSRFCGVADVGTGITYQWVLSGSATVSGTFDIYVGVDTTNPVNVAGVASSSVNGTTATAPTITTTLPNCLVVQCWAVDMTLHTLVFSAGTTRVYGNDSDGQTGAYNAVTDAVLASAGASPQPTATLGSTGSWIARTIALKPLAPTFVITSITDTSTGGTLADATYAYRVVATNAQGHTLPCTEVTHVVANGTGTSTTTTTWNVVPNATAYQVYGRTSGAELLMATLLSPNGSILTWTDNGSISPSGALPTSDTTTDTGQINFGNVLAPTGANITAGYEILQFSDVQQAFAPVFIRMTYGSAASPSNAQIGAATGTSTDGAGNLTSATAFPNTVKATANAFGTSVNSPTNTFTPLYVDSDGGASLMVAGYYNPPVLGPTASGLLIVERTRNWDGTPNAEGIITLNNNNLACTAVTTLIANAAAYQNAPPSLRSFWPIANGGMQGANPPNSMAIGTTVFTVPVFTGYTPKLNGPSKHVVGFMLSDVLGVGVTFTIQPYGANHTYLAFGLTSSGMTNVAISTVDAQLTTAIRIA
jgi:hypothetical protein